MSSTQSPTFPSLHLGLRHSSFSNSSVASSTSQLILQPFHCFIYVTAHCPTLPLLHLQNSSLSNPSIPSSTSQLILQPFHCFIYVTAHSPNLLSLLLRQRLFTQVNCRAAHVYFNIDDMDFLNLHKKMSSVYHFIRLGEQAFGRSCSKNSKSTYIFKQSILEFNILYNLIHPNTSTSSIGCYCSMYFV